MFKKLNSTRLGSLSRLLSISLLTVFIFNGQASAADLNDVQRQIKVSKQTKAQKQKQQELLESELLKSEQSIAKSSLQVNETKKIIEKKRAELITLQKSTTQLESDKVSQQALLQQQLTSAYMAGQNDLVKLLLNQQDLSKVVRAKSYYHYLNKARLESIETLHNTQQELDNNETEQASALASLETMYEEQKQTQKTLEEQKLKRDSALKELNKDINYQTAKLKELKSSEKKLKARLKKAANARQERELASAKIKSASNQTADKDEDKTHSKFAKMKGKLKWPIKGKVLHTFGSTRSSQIKWNGVALAANEGEKVRAVATGRVLFSGYFKGYGMVIALDHSDNYITLYGYNQTLLQKTGDIVFEGDAIALAGHSGGQDKNSLYFELSHKGKAQDPLKWLAPKRR